MGNQAKVADTETNRVPVIKPVKKTRVSDEVVVQLTNLILAGEFAPGDRLPSERELALQLAVNRTSLREALRRMESMRLISVRPGDGVFVQNYQVDAGLEFITFILSTGIGLDRNLILSLAEVRQSLTIAMIEMAADRADTEALNALQKVVDQYPQENGYARLSGEHDFAFFQALAMATGNKVYVYALNSIRDLFEKMSGLFYQVEESSNTAADVYRKLTDALRKSDKKRAVAIFREHMQKDDEMLSRLLGVGR